MKTWWLVLVFFTMIGWVTTTDGQAQDTKETAPLEHLESLEFQDIEELDLEELLDITISIAAGRAQTREEAPSIVSVITAEDIQRMGARTLADVLQTVPGIDVALNISGREIIVVRGIKFKGGSENILLLFNGHRLNTEFNGGATIINPEIPVDNIKQIEIIRGPGSALFGANAFTGVINIVTYTAEDFEGVKVSGGEGSFSSREYSVLAGKYVGDVGLSGFMQYMETNGSQGLIPADFQTTLDQLFAPLGIPPVSRAPGNVADDRKSIDGNMQIVYKGLTVNGRFKDTDTGGFIGTLGILGDSNFSYRQIVLDSSYRHEVGQEGSLVGKISFTQNTTREFMDFFPPGALVLNAQGGVTMAPNGALFEFFLNFRRLGGELTLDYPLFDGQQFTLGINFEREFLFEQELKSNFDLVTLTPLSSFQTVEGTVIPENTSRDIASVFVQDIWNPFPSLGLTLGARYDQYSDFGGTFDPRVGLVWRFARNFNLKLLYGSAFRAPNFFELFYGSSGLLEGNPDLEPSKIQTFEAALGYTIKKKFRFSANYFFNSIRDFIAPTGGDFLGSFVYKSDSGTGMMFSFPRDERNIPGSAFQDLPTLVIEPLSYANSKGIDLQGIEIEMDVSVTQNMSAFCNYTYQYPKDKATGERIPDVPSHLANIGGTLTIWDVLSISPTLIIRGARPRTVADSREDAPGYSVLNLHIQVNNLLENLELSATMENVFDKDTVDPAPVGTIPGDFPRPGRSVFMKARYTF